MNEIFFAHPHTLFNQVDKILQKVGPEEFFKSPDEEVKKAREGFAAYFFTFALKKYTGRDWWLAQPDQVTRAYPDFDFISFSENPDDIKIEKVELTGFYPRFKSFDEALEVVNKKRKKYGNKPVNFSLLVFANHEKSEEWINLLRKKIDTEYPFISVWTIHLLFKKDGKEVKEAVAQRIRPLPWLRFEADMDDSEIHKPQPIPTYIEQHNSGGYSYVTFKADFIDKIKSKLAQFKRK